MTARRQDGEDRRRRYTPCKQQRLHTALMEAEREAETLGCDEVIECIRLALHVLSLKG